MPKPQAPSPKRSAVPWLGLFASDRYPDIYIIKSAGGMVTVHRLFQPFFRAEEKTDRWIAKVSAPPQVRKPPDIVIFSSVAVILLHLIVVKGTLNTNRDSAVLWSCGQSRRLSQTCLSSACAGAARTHLALSARLEPARRRALPPALLATLAVLSPVTKALSNGRSAL